MGEAKRRQKVDPNWGKNCDDSKNSDTNIFGRILQLPEADQLWVIEQMITQAEEQKAKEKLAKKLARKPQTPPDKPVEPHWEPHQTAEYIPSTQ
jgi:hypothetical protein